MSDWGMKKNASALPDPTPYEAYKSGIPKVGQIWTNRLGYKYLCIATHGNFVNALQLSTDSRYECRVADHLYTNPARLSFVKDVDYGHKETEIDESQMGRILDSVSEKLGVSISVGKIESPAYKMLKRERDMLANRAGDLEKRLTEKPVVLETSMDGGIDWHAEYDKLLDKLVNAMVAYGQK